MTRSGPTALYDDDFFAWTQDQAAALRRTAPAMAELLDIPHLAEEIEDLGKRDLREVETFLERIVEHLIKAAVQPDPRDVPHWRSGIRHFRRSARKAFSPSMRRLLDMSQVWRDGHRAASAYLADTGSRNAAPTATPFSLDELLSDDFDVDVALSKLSAARVAEP